MNYTKGEWGVINNMTYLREFPEGHIQIAADGLRDNIAIIPSRWGNPQANANLIAAAPDMYEALKEIVSDLTDIGDCRVTNNSFNLALQALAKAEGK